MGLSRTDRVLLSDEKWPTGLASRILIKTTFLYSGTNPRGVMSIHQRATARCTFDLPQDPRPGWAVKLRSRESYRVAMGDLGFAELKEKHGAVLIPVEAPRSRQRSGEEGWATPSHNEPSLQQKKNSHTLDGRTSQPRVWWQGRFGRLLQKDSFTNI